MRVRLSEAERYSVASQGERPGKAAAEAGVLGFSAPHTVRKYGNKANEVSSLPVVLVQ